ncbi:STAS domain-containing protein [Candidatus Parcubacteria bacterium]|nr:STAS domain-containing protein [Candidatus Parcubacteria bacterium]
MPVAQISQEGEVTVVELPAQLLVGNRHDFRTEVLAQVEGGKKTFVFDFTRTGSIDSSGLGYLVLIQKKIVEAGGTLKLRNLDDDMDTLFSLTKLDTLFEIVK